MFTCEARRLVVRGPALGSFLEHVVPLLDGSRTLDEIEQEVAEVVPASELEGTLSLLVENRLVRDAASGGSDSGRP